MVHTTRCDWLLVGRVCESESWMAGGYERPYLEDQLLATAEVRSQAFGVRSSAVAGKRSLALPCQLLLGQRTRKGVRRTVLVDGQHLAVIVHRLLRVARLLIGLGEQ